MQVVKHLRAGSFWVVTGTPAKLTNMTSGLTSLRNTLKFLGACPSNDVWSKLIMNGFKHLEQCDPIGESLLVTLLKRVLIRHRKEDLQKDLPLLERKQVMLSFSAEERSQYNMYVAFVRSNILLTTAGSSGGWDQNILNPINRKQANALLVLLRVLCCSGKMDSITLSLQDKLRLETIEAFKNEPEQVREHLMHFLSDATSDHTECACGVCGLHLPLLLITRCGHLFCAECANLSACPTCNAAINADDFASIQPGFDINRKSLLDPSLIVMSSKAAYIRERIVEGRLQAIESKSVIKPKFIIFSQFRDVLNVIGDQLIRAFGHDSVAEFWGKESRTELDKFIFNIKPLWICSCGSKNELGTTCRAWLPLATLDGTHLPRTFPRPAETFRDWNPGTVGPGSRLTLIGSEAPSHTFTGYRPCGTTPSQKHPRTTVPIDCDILLLSKDGSHGLDISCATHVFLLDLVWDSGLEEQIVSRAWRFGNKAKKVVVEQLLIRDSVEHILSEHQQQQQQIVDSDAILSAVIDGPETGKPVQASNGTTDTRVKLVFEQLKFVRPKVIPMAVD